MIGSGRMPRKKWAKLSIAMQTRGRRKIGTRAWSALRGSKSYCYKAYCRTIDFLAALANPQKPMITEERLAENGHGSSYNFARAIG